MANNAFTAVCGSLSRVHTKVLAPAGFIEHELEAVSELEAEPALTEVFSQEFIGLYAGVKRGEFETFMQVISPWEREFLLLNV